MRKKKQTWAEKRKFIRLKAHHLMRYKIVDKGKALSFVRDISAGGVLFHSHKYIHPGSIVELQINFPSHAGPIEATSKIVRIRPLSRVGGFEVGAEFIEIDKDSRDFINKKILKVHPRRTKK